MSIVVQKISSDILTIPEYIFLISFYSNANNAQGAFCNKINSFTKLSDVIKFLYSIRTSLGLNPNTGYGLVLAFYLNKYAIKFRVKTYKRKLLAILEAANIQEDYDLALFKYSLSRFKTLKNSAVRRGKTFTLTRKDVYELLKKHKRCHYSNIKLNYYNYQNFKPEESRTFAPYDYPTFERINPSIGYEPGNVVIVAHLYNQMKESIFDTYIHKSNRGDIKLTDRGFVNFLETVLKHIKKEGIVCLSD